MAQTKDFKVAIVGGGMCGLALGVGLAKAGIQVDIFESAPKFEEVGAGVGLGPNAIRALDGLGVLDVVLARSDQPAPTERPFLFLSGLAGHEIVYDYPTSAEDKGLGIHRAAFLDALVTLVDPKAAHFNKRCISVSTSSPSGVYILHFADGTTHEADVVVGADGIKSTIRNAIIENGSKRVVFTNSVASRGLIPNETLVRAGVKTELSRPICFVGPDKHLILFPIKGGEIINVVVFSTNRTVPMGFVNVPSPWVIPVPDGELLEEFKEWGNDVIVILKCLQKSSKWLIHTLNPPLERYVRGKLVLVGDAAHGMLPHLGAGVGQGFEDVFVLCRLLSHPQTNASTLEDVLQAYDYIRPTRANMVIEKSQMAGDIYEAYGTSGWTVEQIRERLHDLWSPIWRHDLEKDMIMAIDWLKDQGSFV